MIDAAKAAGVERLVWSGLPSCTKLSGGKLTHLIHFDGKAAVTEYGRQSGVPFVDVQAGGYASNFLNHFMAPTKQADGSFTIRVPFPRTTQLPIIDMVRDYGLYVRQVLESPVFPDGSEVRTGDYITMEEIALQLSQGATVGSLSGCLLTFVCKQ